MRVRVANRPQSDKVEPSAPVKTSRPARRQRRGALNGRLPRGVASPAGRYSVVKEPSCLAFPGLRSSFPRLRGLFPAFEAFRKAGNVSRTRPEKHSPGSESHSPRIETLEARGTPCRTVKPALLRGERPGNHGERNVPSLSRGCISIATPIITGEFHAKRGNVSFPAGKCPSIDGERAIPRGERHPKSARRASNAQNKA